MEINRRLSSGRLSEILGKETLAIDRFIRTLGIKHAAEKQFDFSNLSEGDVPAGFKSLLSGTGKMGEWKIILDEVPSALKPFSTRAVTSSKRPVLAQSSKDTTDERFPIFLYDEEIFDNFTLTVRFKIVDGIAEQMAGVVFRFQDTNNFYVARANAKDGNVRFYTRWSMV